VSAAAHGAHQPCTLSDSIWRQAAAARPRRPGRGAHRARQARAHAPALLLGGCLARGQVHRGVRVIAHQPARGWAQGRVGRVGVCMRSLTGAGARSATRAHPSAAWGTCMLGGTSPDCATASEPRLQHGGRMAARSPATDQPGAGRPAGSAPSGDRAACGGRTERPPGGRARTQCRAARPLARRRRRRRHRRRRRPRPPRMRAAPGSSCAPSSPRARPPPRALCASVLSAHQCNP